MVAGDAGRESERLLVAKRYRPLVFGQEKDRPRSRPTITIRDGGGPVAAAPSVMLVEWQDEALPSLCQRQPSISPSLGVASMKRSTLCSKSRSSRVSATYIRIRLPQAAGRRRDLRVRRRTGRRDAPGLATTWVEGQVPGGSRPARPAPTFAFVPLSRRLAGDTRCLLRREWSRRC